MNRLLLATDFSTRSDRALRRAALIADRTGAAITLLHVVEDDQPAYLIERQSEAASPLLDDAVATIERFDRVSADMRLETGDVSSTILAVAEEVDAALIVIGPHRRKLKDMFVGTTAERTIRQSKRPVLMANGMPSGAYERTLVALDLDNASRTTVRAARKLGILHNTKVTALHAYDVPGLAMMKRGGAIPDAVDHYVEEEEQQASRAFEKFLVETGLEPDRRLLKPAEGSPAYAVLSCAEAVDAELIVVGTRPRKGAERFFLRSVALEIMREAERDVLVVPTAEQAAAPSA